MLDSFGVNGGMCVPYDSKLYIKEFAVSSSIENGKDFTVTATIKNQGTDDAGTIEGVTQSLVASV